MRGPRTLVRLVRRLVGHAGAHHVLELRHVLYDVTDLHQRHAVLAGGRRLAFAGHAQHLQLGPGTEVHVLHKLSKMDWIVVISNC